MLRGSKHSCSQFRVMALRNILINEKNHPSSALSANQGILIAVQLEIQV